MNKAEAKVPDELCPCPCHQEGLLCNACCASNCRTFRFETWLMGVASPK
jgi:hypothetical protein